MSGHRKTFFCGACEPSKLTDFRRLVRLDDPIFRKPPIAVAQQQPVAQPASRVPNGKVLNPDWRPKPVDESQLRIAKLEQQLAAGGREYDRLTDKFERDYTGLNAVYTRTREQQQAKIDALTTDLRNAEFNAAQWQAKAETYRDEIETTLEKLGSAVKARDEAQAQVAQLSRQVQTRNVPPAPVVAKPNGVPDAPSRRRLTDLIATTIPLRGVRPLTVPPEIDLIYAVLPSENRSKVAQTIRDYLCARRVPQKARGLDEQGRQLFTLPAGRFAITLALDERDEFTIHSIDATQR